MCPLVDLPRHSPMFPSPSLSMYRFLPAPPRVSSFSSVSNPLLSLPLHPELLSELSSLLAPSTQYPSPALSLLTFVLSISLRRLHICAAVVFISAVILFSSPIASLIYPSLSLFLSSGMSHPPRQPLVSCSCSPRPARPARPFPQPQPPVLPVRTKMSAIGRSGLEHVGQWLADPRHAVSSLAGLLPWWGTE